MDERRVKRTWRMPFAASGLRLIQYTNEQYSLGIDDAWSDITSSLAQQIKRACYRSNGGGSASYGDGSEPTEADYKDKEFR